MLDMYVFMYIYIYINDDYDSKITDLLFLQHTQDKQESVGLKFLKGHSHYRLDNDHNNILTQEDLPKKIK